MNSRPFISNNTNVIDETFYTATPTYVNGQNVFVSQEKQRKMFDTLNTSIIGYAPYVNSTSLNQSPYANIPLFNHTPYANSPPLNQPQYPNSSPLNQSLYTNCPPSNQYIPGNFIQAERYSSPSGVVFTFSSPMHHPIRPQQTWPYNVGPYNCCPPTAPVLPPSPLLAYRGYPGNSLRSPEFQQQVSQNPYYFQPQPLPSYSLKFHKDVGTSSADLLRGNTQVPGSQGTADFNNLTGLTYQQQQNSIYPGSYPTDFINKLLNEIPNGTVNSPNLVDGTSSTVRQLIIQTPVSPPQKHVADVLDEQKSPEEEIDGTNKKSVSFSDQISAEKTEKTEQAEQAEKTETSDQTSFTCECAATRSKVKNNDCMKTKEPKNNSTKGNGLKKFFKKRSKSEDSQSYSSDYEYEKEQPKRKKSNGKKDKSKEKKKLTDQETETSDSDYTCIC